MKKRECNDSFPFNSFGVVEACCIHVWRIIYYVIFLTALLKLSLSLCMMENSPSFHVCTIMDFYKFQQMIKVFFRVFTWYAMYNVNLLLLVLCFFCRKMQLTEYVFEIYFDFFHSFIMASFVIFDMYEYPLANGAALVHIIFLRSINLNTDFFSLIICRVWLVSWYWTCTAILWLMTMTTTDCLLFTIWKTSKLWMVQPLYVSLFFF